MTCFGMTCPISHARCQRGPTEAQRAFCGLTICGVYAPCRCSAVQRPLASRVASREIAWLEAASGSKVTMHLFLSKLMFSSCSSLSMREIPLCIAPDACLEASGRGKYQDRLTLAAGRTNAYSGLQYGFMWQPASSCVCKSLLPLPETCAPTA